MSSKVQKRLRNYAFRRASFEVQMTKQNGGLTTRIALNGERLYREIAERTQENHQLIKKLWKASNHRDRGNLTRKMKAMFKKGHPAAV